MRKGERETGKGVAGGWGWGVDSAVENVLVCSEKQVKKKKRKSREV